VRNLVAAFYILTNGVKSLKKRDVKSKIKVYRIKLNLKEGGGADCGKLRSKKFPSEYSPNLNLSGPLESSFENTYQHS
jgi:hypothetical protein